MEPAELHARLTTFAQAHVAPDATVDQIAAMPGHAGFSWGCRVRSAGDEQRLILRLPPPGVRPVANADVVRQGQIVAALAHTAVPVAPVRWYGDDPTWFGRPYLIVDMLPGRTLLLTGGDARTDLSVGTLRAMARATVQAQASLHRLEWTRVQPGLGPPLSLAEEVARCDYLAERTADPELTRDAPALKERLLATLPTALRIGIVHGDFQWSNLLYREDGSVVAVIDWELAGIGATGIDLGWLLVFSDLASWRGLACWSLPLPSVEEIAAMYAEAAGGAVAELAWYRAFAGYKFGLIIGFNLMLHRRGKRPDPLYEEMAPSLPSLLSRGLEILVGEGRRVVRQ